MTSSQLISVDELNESLSRPGLVVIDCRFDLFNPDAGRAAYLESHIPGAVYAHLDDDLAGPVTAGTGRHPLPDPELLAAKLGKWGVASDTKVVVHDAGNGAMAARAWWLLRWLGHSDVWLLNGGYAAWLQANGRISSGEEASDPAQFEANPQWQLVLTTREIVAAGDNVGALNLFDARDAARFRGEVEPIDTVAGHIPGARNMPLGESLQEDGRFKSREALQGLWECVLGTEADDEWSVMCGSGVTACHLALSAIEAGRVEPRVYVGSWSEWIRDPARPVADGNE